MSEAKAMTRRKESSVKLQAVRCDVVKQEANRKYKTAKSPISDFCKERHEIGDCFFVICSRSR